MTKKTTQPQSTERKAKAEAAPKFKIRKLEQRVSPRARYSQCDQ